jgi:hypothetical protein
MPKHDARMDNDITRIALGSVLGPIFWTFLIRLSAHLARRNASRDRHRREQRRQRLYELGVHLGRLCRRAR